MLIGINKKISELCKFIVKLCNVISMGEAYLSNLNFLKKFIEIILQIHGKQPLQNDGES
jgi:hypothetical protein